MRAQFIRVQNPKKCSETLSINKRNTPAFKGLNFFTLKGDYKHSSAQSISNNLSIPLSSPHVEGQNMILLLQQPLYMF